MSAAPQDDAAWDLATRVFHWLLAVLVVVSFTTGKLGGPWLEWHMRSGYAILALLLFRLGWGLVGSRNARFAEFVRGPRAAATHARATQSSRWVGRRPSWLGSRLLTRSTSHATASIGRPLSPGLRLRVRRPPVEKVLRRLSDGHRASY